MVRWISEVIVIVRNDVNNDDNELPPFAGAIVTTQLDTIQSL